MGGRIFPRRLDLPARRRALAPSSWSNRLSAVPAHHRVVVVDHHAVVVDHRAFGVLPSSYHPATVHAVSSTPSSIRHRVLQPRRLAGTVTVPLSSSFVIIDVKRWAATTAVSALIFSVRRGTKNIRARLHHRRTHARDVGAGHATPVLGAVRVPPPPSREASTPFVRSTSTITRSSSTEHSQGPPLMLSSPLLAARSRRLPRRPDAASYSLLGSRELSLSPLYFSFIVDDVNRRTATAASSALVLGVRRGTKKMSTAATSADVFCRDVVGGGPARRQPRRRPPAPVAGRKRPPSPPDPSEHPCACHTGPDGQNINIVELSTSS